MTTPPFDDRDGFIWKNGEIIPWREAKIHVLSHGLHYGGSVFEGERVYDKKVFKLEEHSQRLINSAEMLDMKIEQSLDDICAATEEIIKANNITDGYVRPVAWRGSEEMAVCGKNNRIHVAIACWQWPKYFFPVGGEDKGIALKTVKWRRPAPETAPVHAKAAGNYAIGTLAKHEAMAAGYDDAFMLDYRGHVAESSGANLFFMKDGVMHTPKADCFLNGITRQTVLQMAKDLGIQAIETTIMPEEISQFTEVFATGTAAEITAVGKIDENEFETGSITKKMQEAYKDLTHSIEKQKQAV